MRLAMPMKNKLLKPWKCQTTEKCKFSAGFTHYFLKFKLTLMNHVLLLYCEMQYLVTTVPKFKSSPFQSGSVTMVKGVVTLVLWLNWGRKMKVSLGPKLCYAFCLLILANWPRWLPLQWEFLNATSETDHPCSGMYRTFCQW